MSEASSYQDIISRKSGHAEKPVPIPVGRYLAQIISNEACKARSSGNDGVRFMVRIIRPVDDTDLGDYPIEKLSKRDLRLDFWFTDDALYRLDQFLERDMGLETGEVTYEESFLEVQGEEVIIEIAHQPSQKEGDDTIYSQIDATFPVE